MTYTQTQWAATHDWHLQTVGTATQGFRVIVRNEEPGETDLVFANFAKLRNWAGY